jgi:hypothetical protein
MSYTMPTKEEFSQYLLRLEQLLAVRCACLEGTGPDFLVGAREIIEGNIYLCLSMPGSINARILLAQTVLAMNRARPGIIPEFRERLALLQRERPLGEKASAIVQRLLEEGIKE